MKNQTVNKKKRINSWAREKMTILASLTYLSSRHIAKTSIYCA